MDLNASSYYALMALAYLAQKEDRAACSEICQATGMPVRYVLQLLRKLAAAGVLEAYRGVLGGYRLARPARQISLLDVVTAIDGPIEAALPEVLSRYMVRSSREALAQKLEESAEHARKVMAAFTVDQLKVNRVNLGK